MTSPDPDAPLGAPEHSLRELNKERTRRALADAAYAIAVERGIAAVTAESVAQAAGVSRRTFFNYFPSTVAVLSAPVEEFLDRARTNLAARPVDEPLVVSAIEVFTSAADPELVRRAADLARLLDTTPDTAVAQVEAWAAAESGLADVLADRLTAPGEQRDDLHPQAIAASLLGALRAGMFHWLRTNPGPVDDASLERLTDTLVRTLQHLADAYVAPGTPAHAIPDPHSRTPSAPAPAHPSASASPADPTLKDS